MKPLTMLFVGALIVALLVVGYLYYQRTRNDITIQLPKVGLIVDQSDLKPPKILSRRVVWTRQHF